MEQNINQKIIIRVANVPEAKTEEAVEEEWREWMDDSVVVCMTVDETIKKGLTFAVELLQHRADLDDVKVGIKASVYESNQLVDENLFDELWEDYAGRCVNEFPAVTGDPDYSFSPELVVTRPQGETLSPEDSCVWISYRPNPDDYLYSAPVKYLGELAEKMFLENAVLQGYAKIVSLTFPRTTRRN